jgi:hypothetical protein
MPPKKQARKRKRAVPDDSEEDALVITQVSLIMSFKKGNTLLLNEYYY